MEIPKQVLEIIQKLENSNFEAYVVGGCVRDFLLGIKPKDWDITTSAKPEQIQELFPKSFYENSFGTVTIIDETPDLSLKNIEITPFRLEGKYSDKRHPDEIKFADNLEDDLKRRDFTINALALRIKDNKLIDLFDGQKDLTNKVLRTVGDANERFNEDALRMLRAIRLSYELGFEIESKTLEAIKQNSNLLELISEERIRDELLRIVKFNPESIQKNKKSDEVNETDLESGPARIFETMRELGMLKIIIPELEIGWGIGQNKHHIYDVWEHNLRSFTYAVKEDFNWQVRLAALFHDIGKPKTKAGEGSESTFYGHDVLGARMAKQIMNRLKFSKKDIDKVVLLIRYHLFQSDPEKITDSAVRRVVRNVGQENIWDLINLRICDRIGSGVPKAEPYRLRKFLVMLEKALREPVSLKQLNINGQAIMEILNIEPGPKIGYILSALMNEILDSPENNEKEKLEKRAKELNELPIEQLGQISEKAKEKMEQIEYEKEEETKKKYWVS